MEPSAAQTFQDWATGAAAIATAVAIIIGGGWALWRYVLPGPLGVDWQDDVPDCRVRKATSGPYVYTAEVGLTNMSNAVFFVRRAAICIMLPTEVPIEQEPPTEVCKARLDKSEFVVTAGRCPPNRCKALPGSLVDATLSDVVIVAWRIRYKRPRWFGFIGRKDEYVESERYVPVDADSLRLYQEHGEVVKEDNDD